MSPAVTVLLPLYNGEAFVRDAIASILGQTFTDFELLIVDDGSTDATASVVASFADPRIRLLTSPENEGLARALNRGLDAATAPLIARQDADDVSHPPRLATQLAFLRAHPEIALVGAQVRVIDRRGRVMRPPGWRRPLTHAGIRFQSMFDNPFIHSTVVFRRELAGTYDPSFVSEDFDLWSRIASRHAVANLPQVLVDFRMHAASTVANWTSAHIAGSSAIIERNLREVLDLDDVPSRWPPLLASLHVDSRAREPIDHRELLDIFIRICDRWRELHPQRDRDVARVAATKLGEIALLLAPSDRRAAFHAFARAWRLDVRTASAYATRIIPRVLLGDVALEWWRR